MNEVTQILTAIGEGDRLAAGYSGYSRDTIPIFGAAQVWAGPGSPKTANGHDTFGDANTAIGG